MKIVAFAYACEPGKGSEPGAGWAFAKILASIGEVWVLTRENNQPAIEEALFELPEKANLHFVYVDLPPWARFWKRGRRGMRLYYLIWQFTALITARKLNMKLNFDLSWHLTLANVWLGSVASIMGSPFIYGPVGGGVTTPWRFLPALGIKGSLREILRASARFICRYCNPIARVSWRRAGLILAQNNETRQWLPRKYRGKVIVFPNAIVDDVPRPLTKSSGHSPTAFFAGELLPLKGLSLAIRALVLLPHWRLIICGKGPDEARLKRLARRLKVDDRVHFRGWVPRHHLFRLLAVEASVGVFPSLHDEAGWAVAETVILGLPVVCLNRGGPPLLGGMAVPSRRLRETVEQLAKALRECSEQRPNAQPDGLPSREKLLLILKERGFLRLEEPFSSRTMSIPDSGVDFHSSPLGGNLD